MYNLFNEEDELYLSYDDFPKDMTEGVDFINITKIKNQGFITKYYEKIFFIINKDILTYMKHECIIKYKDFIDTKKNKAYKMALSKACPKLLFRAINANNIIKELLQEIVDYLKINMEYYGYTNVLYNINHYTNNTIKEFIEPEEKSTIKSLWENTVETYQSTEKKTYKSICEAPPLEPLIKKPGHDVTLGTFLYKN